MLSKQFGSLVRARRRHQGLKQSDLACSAGVSRTVLSALETGVGRPVQTDVLDRLLDVLELRPRVLDDTSPDASRMQARLEHARRLNQQRSRHLRLAVELAGDSQAAGVKIEHARQRVELWRRKGSCSPFYIERWSEILQLSPPRMARAMASLGEWEDAMFQNSPWSGTWT